MKLKIAYLLVLLFLFISLTVSAEQVCDFDGNNTVDLKDVAYLLAWYQSGGSAVSPSKTLVTAVASELLSAATGPLTRLPSESVDDLSGDGLIDLNDVALMLAWYQSGGQSNSSFSLVESIAQELLSSANFISKFPGTPIGDSSFTTTITGITTDP